MIRFQEAQVINPFAHSFQLSFQIDPGFLTCKKVISVTRFQIEADAFIIIVILRKIFFKRIIVPLDETLLAEINPPLLRILNISSVYFIVLSSMIKGFVVNKSKGTPPQRLTHNGR